MPNATVREGPPILGGISGFKHPYNIYGIVPNSYGEYDNIPSYDVKFFGYKEQCEKHLSEYPNCIIVKDLQEKIITQFNFN